VYLPHDRELDHPDLLVIEYPGNSFFTPSCYSSGLPDQTAIGYGMTRGAVAI